MKLRFEYQREDSFPDFDSMWIVDENGRDVGAIYRHEDSVLWKCRELPGGLALEFEASTAVALEQKIRDAYEKVEQYKA